MSNHLLNLCLAPLFLIVAGCGSSAEPALWRVDRADAASGAEPAGWLFGTIHALPAGTDWHGDTLDMALADADVLMVEISDLDRAEGERILTKLAIDPSLPPIRDRVSPLYRDELEDVMDEAGADPANFNYVETWAAALTLASMLQQRSRLDPDHGVDQSLIADWQGRPVIGLETTEEQFRIFDQLSGDEQQALLESLVAQAEEMAPEALSDAWIAGDTDKLAGLMDMGFEANSDLRAALLGRRNRRWVGPIVGQLQDGKQPFVAVGAGHMGGNDGLIALLEARGWKVTRVQ
ncbi:TraB/GumN family protein [Croceicoccus ponticola]|uniref:TraB/GumN family protein n=1 Tax=Croceicoccus ponticola TaxID=2217664 RepID=A0A437H0Z4_9SPHN|nr:TraB/GumN family protein [Croceicoccus ponticola]RVQ69182.1 TraB/GumN family protein [Croceicoccus ponticola]